MAAEGLQQDLDELQEYDEDYQTDVPGKSRVQGLQKGLEKIATKEVLRNYAGKEAAKEAGKTDVPFKMSRDVSFKMASIMEKCIKVRNDYMDQLKAGKSKKDAAAEVAIKHGIKKATVFSVTKLVTAACVGMRIAGHCVPAARLVSYALVLAECVFPEIDAALVKVAEATWAAVREGAKRVEEMLEENIKKKEAEGRRDFPAHVLFGGPPPPPPGTGMGGGRPAGCAGGYPHACGGVDLGARSTQTAMPVDSHSQSQSSVLLYFDPATGLLFQRPVGGGQSMAFTDSEMSTALCWMQKALDVRSGKSARAAFSLDPTQPSDWERAGGNVEGLFQRKWYSHDSLKSSPVGYWMWRADWKLKQLSHGVLYDDATGARTPVCPGVHVPAGFPDPAAGEPEGTARMWIVCRSITLRPLGKNVMCVHPSDVRMGVERRAMVYDARSNQFVDAEVGAADSHRSPMANFMDNNYDLLAKFHPEFWHCKRMAALLAVAQWMLGPDGPLYGKRVQPQTLRAMLPRDFPEDRVPAIKTQTEKGTREKQVLKQKEAQVAAEKSVLEDCKRTVGCLKHTLEEDEKCLQRMQGTVDHYSAESVDAYNAQVGRCKARQASYNEAVERHNRQAGLLRSRTQEYNNAVGACNAVCRTHIITGGVNLDCQRTVQQPFGADEREIAQHFRPLAEELVDNPDLAQLLQHQDGFKLPPVDLLEELDSQRDVQLNVFPVVVQPLLQPIGRAAICHVIIHSLQEQRHLNGRAAVLQSSMQGEETRYMVAVGNSCVQVRRLHFVPLNTQVRLVDLKDCMLNGQRGEIVRVECSSAEQLRYIVKLTLTSKEVAVKPENVLLPLGSTVVVRGLTDPEHNGREGMLEKVFPAEWNEAEGKRERKCQVQLMDGRRLKLKTAKILA